MRTPALELTIDPALPASERLAVWELTTAVLEEYDLAGIEERDACTWHAYFASADIRDRARRALEVHPGISGRLAIESFEVSDQDWARRTQAELRALQVGRVIVAPPWDVPPRPADRVVLVIEPSTGFGTGHHASTRLCLQLLQRLDLAGRTVLDAGTGSGILAIAAARLGAREVVAVDRDPDALVAARANAQRNGVAEVITFRLGDLRDETLLSNALRFPVDVVSANLTAAFFERHGGTLAKRVAAGGWLVASGFELPDESGVIRALGRFGVLVDRDVEDTWVGQCWQIVTPGAGRPR